MTNHFPFDPKLEGKYKQLYSYLVALDCLETKYNASALAEADHNNLKSNLLEHIETIRIALKIDQMGILRFAQDTSVPAAYIEKAIYGYTSDGEAININSVVNEFGQCLVEFGNLIYTHAIVSKIQYRFAYIVGLLQKLQIADEEEIRKSIYEVQKILSNYTDPNVQMIHTDRDPLVNHKERLKGLAIHYLSRKHASDAATIRNAINVGIRMETFYDSIILEKVEFSFILSFFLQFKGDLLKFIAPDDSRRAEIDALLKHIEETIFMGKNPTDLLSQEDKEALLKTRSQFSDLLFNN